MAMSYMVQPCSAAEMMHGVADMMCDAANMIHGVADMMAEKGMAGRPGSELHPPLTVIWKI